MRIVLAAALFSPLFAHTAFSAIIYESAIGNVNSLPAPGIHSEQFLGSRFTLGSTTHITGIGGAFAESNNSIFGTIVEMNGLLPQGRPFNDTEVLLSTVFHALPIGDHIAPVSITLPSGDYALVFGSGLFGANGGGGAMDYHGTNTAAGAGSYFYWEGENWVNGGTTNKRFIVTGFIPEPTSALALVGCLALAALLFPRGRREARD